MKKEINGVMYDTGNTENYPVHPETLRLVQMAENWSYAEKRGAPVPAEFRDFLLNHVVAMAVARSGGLSTREMIEPKLRAKMNA